MKQRQFFIILSLVMLAGLYQNFSSADLKLPVISHENRTKHAQELLGNLYSGSNAEAASQISDIHLSIYEKIKNRLPTKYKSQSSKITQTLIEQSEFYDLDPIFVLAIIETESNFNPVARGPFKEVGLMQLKPDTAKWIANKEGIWWTGIKCLENPITNIKIGTAYVNYLRNKFDGHANKYLAAYNMGPLNVKRVYASERKPKEYPMKVMKKYVDMYSSITSNASSAIKISTSKVQTRKLASTFSDQ